MGRRTFEADETGNVIHRNSRKQCTSTNSRGAPPDDSVIMHSPSSYVVHNIGTPAFGMSLWERLGQTFTKTSLSCTAAKT